VHPFEEVPDPTKPEKLTNELPVDAALGKVDYYEVTGFADHKASAEVWYKLLNLGFRIAAAGGTDAMTNYASLHGPVGLNRTYVRGPRGSLNGDAWLEGLKRGRSFATNGPLLRFTLGDQPIGGELKLKAPADDVKFSATLRSLMPVDHLQIVCNGQVAKDLSLAGSKDSADVSGTLPLAQGGWCLLRTWSNRAEFPILDYYLYASTSPVYVSIEGLPERAPDDARYFIAWIDRVIDAATKHTGYNTDAEKQTVLQQLQAARAVYVEKAK
jgi:hypothetical protein